MKHNPSLRRPNRALALVTVLSLSSLLSFAQDVVPKHVELARAVVQNIKPEDNVYSNTRRRVLVPTDLFSSGYTVWADCTFFVESMFYKSTGFIPHFSTKMFPDRYSIIDWVNGIEKGETFAKVSRIQDLKVGDLVAWKFLKPTSELNGHIVIVNAVPIKRTRSTMPAKAQFDRWEVQVIDAFNGPESADDTRYVVGTTAAQAEEAVLKPEVFAAMKTAGVGRGKYFVFTDESGVIQAMSYGFLKGRIYKQSEDWQIVMASQIVK